MSSHPSRRIRRFHPALVALIGLAALSACTARQDKSPDAPPMRQSAPASPANPASPMLSFARLVSGEWRVTAQSGTSMFHTWHWGPGRHSVRRMTDGTDAAGNPWRELRVYSWHPGLEQIRLLGLAPFSRSMMEGSIRFEGPGGPEEGTADAVFDLYQTGVRRKMGQRWDFDGPDKYHEVLLEATGSKGFETLAEWDHVRSQVPNAVEPRTAGDASKPSGDLKPLEALLGRTWEAQGAWTGGGALSARSTFEWIPVIDAVYVRVAVPGQDGEAGHLLDAYVYHHTGTDKLRCLALTNRGGVYEGDVTGVDGDALELDLKGYEGDRTVTRAVRFDFEKEGTLRQRVWSTDGAERKLLLDVRHH